MKENSLFVCLFVSGSKVKGQRNIFCHKNVEKTQNFFFISKCSKMLETLSPAHKSGKSRKNSNFFFPFPRQWGGSYEKNSLFVSLCQSERSKTHRKP